MDYELPHQELVKCVVVGDTAVGKTRLICAKACNKRFTLAELLNTHVPTVWAIDQYRIYKEVLERSCAVIDGVNVSLRLWDTFGDHDKDRRFAYGRSDVVLLCFSISNPVSLRNCKLIWYPEIRKFCPTAPILLVGCKNDLRYVYKDEEYLQFCKDRSPLVRSIRESDIIMPAEGRAIAQEIGVEYYETSAFSFYGVTELFNNVIRSALISRRQHKFWMTNLKRVQKPKPQVPFCPPKPKLIEPTAFPSSMGEDLHNLYQDPAFYDLILIADNTYVCLHKMIALASSLAFQKLFMKEMAELGGNRRFSESSEGSSMSDADLGNFDIDTKCLIPRLDQRLCDKFERNWLKESFRDPEFFTNKRRFFKDQSCSLVQRNINHPAFQSITINDSNTHWSSSSHIQQSYSKKITNVVKITMSKFVTGPVLLQLVHFMYTGSIFCKRCCLYESDLSQLGQVAEFLEMVELQSLISTYLRTGENGRNDSSEYVQVLCNKLSNMCLDDILPGDIVLELDDGSLWAHRGFLVARCDVMKAMFLGDFKESYAKIITFPGVKLRTFQIFLHYIYTDSISSLKIRECVPIVELANRLCLPRLMGLVEQEVVSIFERILNAGGSINEDCLHLLEALQMHNAEQLVDWCLAFIASNYNQVCHKHSKALRSLHPENQAWLNCHRWPPVWYLKDFDYYEKCAIERQREDEHSKNCKRMISTSSGCLCFVKKNRKSYKLNYKIV